ncbi:MAG: hypothetical protein ISS57_06520 [Anaerolineales bacterium]|nr:hypothetical protein [Anaerolineales bacterium]
MSFLKFTIRCGPIFILVALIAALGYHLGEYIPSEWWLLPAAGALVLLITLQIFKLVPRLNFILLLGLALSAGALLNWFDLGDGNWFPWIVLSLGLISSLAWGYLLGIRLGWISSLFFPLTIVYLLVWFLIYLVPGLAAWMLAWAIIGMFLFVGQAIHIVTEARYSKTEEVPVPLVSDLFITYFNLFWIGAVIDGLMRNNFG